MSRRTGLGLFLLTTFAFGMDVNSLPVWDPSVLVRDVDYVVPNAATADSVQRKDSLETHGYKTMQITVGDGGTQVDQELRLSIQGRLTDDVVIDALLSDVGRKAGDQTTSTLREVDQIYFRVQTPHTFLHLGDLTWSDESMGLYSLDRSSLGVMAGVHGGFGGGQAEVKGVYGSDEVQHFSRVINGVSGQREGYSLDASGSFISVVPQSETVWLNGRKLKRGVDYVVNYAGGMLDFKGSLVTTFDDEIRVEYDAYEEDQTFTLYGAAAKYRHPNLYLDVSGFRLTGEARDSLTHPMQNDRFGARLRTQWNKQFYADVEVAMNRADSNTASHDVGGPEGKAVRWYITSDSTQNLSHLPVALSVYGNRVQQGFDILENQGSDLDWNAYRLLDDWDLTDADGALLDDDLIHDEFALRMRLGGGWFGNASWGYRRNGDESWNSSRVNLTLSHKGRSAHSDLAFTHVASFQNQEKERYQATLKSVFDKGVVRPFGTMDFRYTEINYGALSDEVLYGKTNGGFGIYLDKGEVKETVGGKIAKRRGDSFGADWLDSLKAATWLQEANYNSRYFSVSHLLQYERIVTDSTGADNSWVGDLNGKFGHENIGLHGTVNYKLGLTEEQIYTAVYKAVAPGTGDVRYDSLTGTYIEGVDNGDFVYEGQGRNDSVGAVRASDASFNLDIRWNPGAMFGIKNGFLRDVTIGGSVSSEGNDTTGRTIYFPPMTKSQLMRTTSGRISFEGLLDWTHPAGINVAYKPGLDYDKKLSSISYYEKILSHNVEGGYQINPDHFVGAELLLQDEELSALQKWNWNIYDGTLKYRLDFMNGFFVQPLGRYRKGVGDDGVNLDFEADLWEGALRVGYNRQKKVNAFANFSVINVDKGGSTTPYQVMSGYNDGTTYRLELSVSLDLNNFISLGCNYVLRFGDAEENAFQKLSTEAKAYF
ncbi:MAG: hypothetical protein MJZ25_10595 [Fibrobacter sp.]|nr:hypothetical protein [Fibrobacter sp.]